MAFDSFDAFLAMGGHGPYVWACYLVFFVLSIVLVVWSRRQRQTVLKHLAQRQSSATGTTTGPASADFARVNPSKQ